MSQELRCKVIEKNMEQAMELSFLTSQEFFDGFLFMEKTWCGFTEKTHAAIQQQGQQPATDLQRGVGVLAVCGDSLNSLP